VAVKKIACFGIIAAPPTSATVTTDGLDRAGRRPYTERLSGGGSLLLSTGHFFTAARMAEGKKAKTAEKGGDAARKRLCPSCGAESRVVQFTGFGPRGFYWVCDKNCGYSERTR
jgi:hypothetical protein